MSTKRLCLIAFFIGFGIGSVIVAVITFIRP